MKFIDKAKEFSVWWIDKLSDALVGRNAFVANLLEDRLADDYVFENNVLEYIKL